MVLGTACAPNAVHLLCSCCGTNMPQERDNSDRKCKFQIAFYPHFFCLLFYLFFLLFFQIELYKRRVKLSAELRFHSA